MQEEIFRFSIIRNPQIISKEKVKTSVIHLIDQEDGIYPLFTKLKAVEKIREKIVSTAKNGLRTGGLLQRKTLVNSTIGKFSEWLSTQKKLNSKTITQEAERLFGSLNKFVASEKFKLEKFKISDSIIVVSIVKPDQNGLRSELMRARRIVFLLESLAKPENANLTTKGIREILNATILLPNDLFPIPDENAELREKNIKAHDQRKEKIQNRIDKINVSSEKLRANSEAIDELTELHSKHLFEINNKPLTNRNDAISLTFLPANKVNKLSVTTKKALNNLSIHDTMVDVPFVVAALESENTRISKKIDFSIGDNEAFNPADVAVIVEKTCGACEIAIVDEVKKPNNFTGQTKGKVNQIGAQDLMMVRQSLLMYEPGEIAHIENVLKGESKSKTHRKLHRIEETVFEETEQSEEVENELETTDRFELQSETSKTIAQDKSIEAGVTVTAKYGPTKIEAFGNYASSTATEESRNSSSSYAKDVVSRSLKNLKERVLKRRSKTQINEVEIINKHKIDNTNDNAENIAGIYHWVNKLYETQIVDYGTRTMLEFMIPEPAAFYRFACDQQANNLTSVKEPNPPGFCQAGKFFPLKPTDLSASNYMCFVGNYNMGDAQPPPPSYTQLTDVMQYKSEATAAGPIPIGEENTEFEITDGYHPIMVGYKITGGNVNSILTEEHDEILIQVTIGGTRVFSLFKSAVGHETAWSKTKQLVDWDNEFSAEEKNHFQGNKKGKLSDTILVNSDAFFTQNTSSIPISITGHSTLPLSMSIHYTVLCKRSSVLYQQWQMETFNAIMSAYERLKFEYDESLENQQYQAGGYIQGENPLINREVEKTELKKHAISILTGQQYEGFNAMGKDHRQGLGYPEMDLEDASKEGEFVQFFEQALEWRHATYLFYDYFWGRKENWIDTMKTKDVDPLFEKFLKAGYARVWIPIRPSFEPMMLNYIKCGGEPWSEKDAPQVSENEVGDDNEQSPSISMIEEMKEQLDNDFVQRPGTISVTEDSNILIGTGTDFSKDDVDREILIHLESYRIAEFVSATEIALREPYLGEDDTNIGVIMGIKYVGEPWVVEVPTSLVYLQEDGTL
ncbi:MAG: hypothetical protein COB15_14045 [Flavobacteriales bacterium]|nr:MAG: hypothetical protein COB15_14045 [Flavobacteriales bacterium]